jgi:hypothetical protein
MSTSKFTKWVDNGISSEFYGNDDNLGLKIIFRFR